jgi:hypothetical protein
MVRTGLHKRQLNLNLNQTSNANNSVYDSSNLSLIDT